MIIEELIKNYLRIENYNFDPRKTLAFTKKLASSNCNLSVVVVVEEFNFSQGVSKFEQNNNQNYCNIMYKKNIGVSKSI